MNKENKKIYFIGALAFFGAMAGVILISQAASANVLQDFLNNLKTFFSQPAPTNISPVQNVLPYQPAIDSHEEAVIKAIEKASPAVVSIIISKNVPIIEECPFNPFSDLPRGWQDLFGGDFGFEFSQPCQRGSRLQEVGGGSGFIVSADGLILTNKHVVEDKNASYTVLTNDGKKHDAKVVAQDPVLDLAIVKINASGLPILTLGDSDGVRLGQSAIAIGNALGEFRNTVSVGVISGLSRNVTASSAGGAETIEGVFQTDAAINPGNSGGPLLNLKGEVIGINTAMVSGAQSIGFAIPANKAKRAIDSVKRSGRIIVPYIGLRYISITPELAEEEKLPVSAGALVRGSEAGPGVIKNSPADKAGFKAEDIVLEINGEKINADRSLGSLIQKYNVGDRINLKVLRDGKEMNLEATLEERI